MTLQSIDQVNKLPETEFISLFANVVEHCPQCAQELFELRPFTNVNDVIFSVNRFLSELSAKDLQKILQLHPDLAGKLAEENKLTEESSSEQKAAGLDTLNNEQKKLLSKKNQMYKEKFGFPFVICARENKFSAIVDGFENRMKNSKQLELYTAMEEVKKISAYRVRQIVTDT